MNINEYYLCIDLGGTKLFACLLNARGVIVRDVTITNHGTTQEDTFSLLCKTIDSLLAYAFEKDFFVGGLGIGVPGITDFDSGTVIHAPSLHWKNFPLKQRLAERYSVPICIENDVNCAAFGLWNSFYPELHSLSFISVGTGIGCGSVFAKQIHRGFHFASGEVGCTLADVTDLHVAHPTFGSMESLASGTGIANQLRHLSQPDLPAWAQNATAQEVFAAYRKNDPLAQKIVNNTRDHLAMLIVSVATTLDPEVIFLGGGVFNTGYFLVPQLAELAQSKLHFPLKLRLFRQGQYCTVLGLFALLMP